MTNLREMLVGLAEIVSKLVDVCISICTGCPKTKTISNQNLVPWAKFSHGHDLGALDPA